MHASFVSAGSKAKTVPILCLTKSGLRSRSKGLSAAHRRWLEASGFTGEEGQTALLPAADGALEAVAVGLGADARRCDPFIFGKLPGLLPKGTYAFSQPPADAFLACLAFALGAYGFDRYKKKTGAKARLKLPKEVDANELSAVADALWLTRDLINTPANDMGPEQLEEAARKLARSHKAKISVTKGAELLKKNFPLIHAVGRASDQAPRLIDMSWGKASHPKVTLVGKGVCFDTGGLDLKPPAAMLLMKKDMGGAANVLGLAAMVMAAGLPVNLRVLVPAVENSVSGNAFRPGDVLASRKGLSVEIGNTDAEGRLVLADALALADEDTPELVIDMATLTGAARVALGPDLPPFYTDDDRLAAALARHAEQQKDPLWRMPFHAPYDTLLDSRIADVNHISSGPHAGSITAALFLRRFVEKAKSYVHFDIFAWSPRARPGRPEGGEAQGIRALYALLKDRYGK